MTNETATDTARSLRSANRKTALVLLAIAIVFFVGIIAVKFIGSPATGIAIMGTVVLLFLVVAIGRNLRGTDDRAPRSRGAKGASASDSPGADARPLGPPGAANGAPK